MYRTNDRTPTPPTVIEYRSRWFRPGYLFLGFALFVIGVLLVGSLRVSRITCDRYGDSMIGFCAVKRYAIVGAFDVDVPLEAIDSLDVRVVKGSKGGQYAEVVLLTKPGSGLGRIDVERSGWIGTDVDIAMAARSALSAFVRDTSAAHLDVWIRRSIAAFVLNAVFAVVFGSIGLGMLREQLGQLRPIRVVVDHERRVVIVRKREIPIDEIRKVEVDSGQALFWSSGKNEYVPGWRLLIKRRGRDGDVICVTDEFRAGNASGHEQARKDILRAIGRPVVD